MSPLRVVPYGPNALLIRFAAEPGEPAFQRCQALVRHLDQAPLPGLLELTPAFTTLLLEFEPGSLPSATDLRTHLDPCLRPDPATHSFPTPPIHEIPVVYDGPDLRRVADHSGLSIREVCERHAAPTYTVHMLGFCPGFSYLHGLDPILHTPRLPTPRPRVNPGSVAIGGSHAGVYPLPTAGGWNLIGRTDLAIVNLTDASKSPFLLSIGDSVRFLPVDHTSI